MADLPKQLPKGLSGLKILCRLTWLAAGPLAAQNSFLVIEASNQINRALDDGLHPLEALSVLAARIQTKTLIEIGRDLSRSHLLLALKPPHLGHERLDYARLLLNGSDHVSISATLKAD